MLQKRAQSIPRIKLRRKSWFSLEKIEFFRFSIFFVAVFAGEGPFIGSYRQKNFFLKMIKTTSRHQIWQLLVENRIFSNFFPESGSGKRFQDLGMRAIDSPHKIRGNRVIFRKNF